VTSFFEWFTGTTNPLEPWLILGKGPSYALGSHFDLGRFHLMSLNHAVREQPVLAAHVIDLDVIRDCADVIEHNSRVLVMPWYPHVRNAVGDRSLDQLAREIPILQRLEREGRLLWYDLSTSPVRHGSVPVVEATYFSAEAALNLLALAGVRRVRTLGVDGGSEYSGAFEDLRASTLLANGRTSFDLQFAGFARTILQTGVDFAPLDLPAPARVYVAYRVEETLPLAVLQQSIRRHCSLTVEVVAVSEGAEVAPGEGQAVLLPARAQVLADLRPLWRAGVGDGELLVPRDAGGGVGPCLAVAGRDLGPAIPWLASLIRQRAPLASLTSVVGGRARATLPADWNPGSEPDHEALMLYYAADGTEPWLVRDHPLGHLWVRDLLQAVAHGFVAVGLVSDAVRLGHVRPSLLYQVEHGVEEPLLLPRRARLLDRDFPSGNSLSRKHSATSRWLGAVTRAVGRQAKRRVQILRARRSPRPGPVAPQPTVASPE
jgi:hypothetical protein